MSTLLQEIAELRTIDPETLTSLKKTATAISSTKKPVLKLHRNWLSNTLYLSQSTQANKIIPSTEITKNFKRVETGVLEHINSFGALWTKSKKRKLVELCKKLRSKRFEIQGKLQRVIKSLPKHNLLVILKDKDTIQIFETRRKRKVMSVKISQGQDRSMIEPSERKFDLNSWSCYLNYGDFYHIMRVNLLDRTKKTLSAVGDREGSQVFCRATFHPISRQRLIFSEEKVDKNVPRTLSLSVLDFDSKEKDHQVKVLEGLDLEMGTTVGSFLPFLSGDGPSTNSKQSLIYSVDGRVLKLSVDDEGNFTVVGRYEGVAKEDLVTIKALLSME